eukprot:Protomagalhaensia_sp_Gyna_25__3327@NODE_3009_length_775_cov_749_790761_g2512_i0_p1_GENE_NODE_3009_length_775_cov_749_790761_g2512_i0NODE_3009_length_775_cov_749_790761_g2512_i0_p1_ORF_typecomplete_len165_score24_32_NODE_3009_length_775_cov_749_790761_g2512_i0168662
MMRPIAYTTNAGPAGYAGTTTTTSSTTRYSGPATGYTTSAQNYSPGIPYTSSQQVYAAPPAMAYPTVYPVAPSPAYNATTYPAPTYYPTTQAATAAVQYTSEATQKYVPPGCQPVAAFPHGISTIYSTGLVPAFVAAPDVKIPSTVLLNLGGEQITTTQGVVRH